MKKKEKIAAVAIVALLVVLALVFAFNYSSAQGKGWFGSSAEIYINVDNLNSGDDIDVTITVNGHEVGKKTLREGNDWTLTYKPFFFGDNATYEIEIDVDGGILDDWDAERTITVAQGESRNVIFVIG